MPPKKFPLLDPSDRQGEPLQFALGDEVFTCLPEMPVAATHALVSFASPIRGAMAFIRGALIAADEERFDEIVNSKRLIVTEDVLMDVLTYVSEAYTARPTLRPTSSPDGGSTTNDGSLAGSPFAEAAAP